MTTEYRNDNYIVTVRQHEDSIVVEVYRKRPDDLLLINWHKYTDKEAESEWAKDIETLKELKAEELDKLTEERRK